MSMMLANGLQIKCGDVILNRAQSFGGLTLQPQSVSSEAALIERAVRRDVSAFTALYDGHVNRVYRHVYYWVRSQADAEDITQEVFVRAWKSFHKYKHTGAPLIAWLSTIARNLITDHYRARKKLVPLDEAMELDCGEDADPAAITEASFDRGFVRDGILRLKGEQQQVIVMRFIDGLNYDEVARALNKSEGAIRVIQFRALKELRRILGEKR